VPLGEGDDPIGFTEREKASWEAWLATFDTIVYPTFAKWGYSRNTALQAFMMNNLVNVIADSMTTAND